MNCVRPDIRDDLSGYGGIGQGCVAGRRRAKGQRLFAEPSIHQPAMARPWSATDIEILTTRVQRIRKLMEKYASLLRLVRKPASLAHRSRLRI